MLSGPTWKVRAHDLLWCLRPRRRPGLRRTSSRTDDEIGKCVRRFIVPQTALVPVSMTRSVSLHCAARNFLGGFPKYPAPTPPALTRHHELNLRQLLQSQRSIPVLSRARRRPCGRGESLEHRRQRERQGRRVARHGRLLPLSFAVASFLLRCGVVGGRACQGRRLPRPKKEVVMCTQARCRPSGFDNAEHLRP